MRGELALADQAKQPACQESVKPKNVQLLGLPAPSSTVMTC